MHQTNKHRITAVAQWHSHTVAQRHNTFTAPIDLTLCSYHKLKVQTQDLVPSIHQTNNFIKIGRRSTGSEPAHLSPCLGGWRGKTQEMCSLEKALSLKVSSWHSTRISILDKVGNFRRRHQLCTYRFIDIYDGTGSSPYYILS